jgi:hypothetical protein
MVASRMQLFLISHARRKMKPSYLWSIPISTRRPISELVRQFTENRYPLPWNKNDPKPLWTSFSIRKSSTVTTLESEKAEPTNTQNAVVSEAHTPEHPEVVLYRRDLSNPDAMHTTTLMRSGFFFSTFHTLYWVWYTFDFLPAVNASPMTVLHVDPMIGVAGIGFALALQSAFMIFPRRLISKLTYRPDEQRICIHTHRLPLMYPSVIKPNASFPVGPPKVVPASPTVDSTSSTSSAPPKEDMASLKAKSKQIAAANARAAKKIRYFTLDASTPAALSLIEGDSQGDISKHRGYIVVGPSWPRYVLDIKAASEVKEPALLLKILLHPETFQYKVRKEERKASSLTPFQLRAKARQRKVVAPSRKFKRR